MGKNLGWLRVLTIDKPDNNIFKIQRTYVYVYLIESRDQSDSTYSPHFQLSTTLVFSSLAISISLPPCTTPCHRASQRDSGQDKESETAGEEAEASSNAGAGETEGQDQRAGTAESHRNHESETEAEDGTIAGQH